jgi:hypothetical protein
MASHRAFHSAIGLSLLIAAAAAPWPASAQTSLPRPNFTLRAETRFWYGAWPGDFNRDGRTDLIAGTGPGPGHSAPDEPRSLIVALGRGDGTFGTSRTINIAAQPIGTGDFNGDSKLDVVISGPGGAAVLPGNGNGTFAAPRTISASAVAAYPFAIVGDFNADGHRDVALGRDGGGEVTSALLLFPGNGDFTFAPEVTIPLEIPGADGISGDFNGDGRRDMAVVTFCCSLFVMINRGGLMFDVHETPMFQDLGDITTADINRDGKLDLLIAASSELVSPGSSAPSVVDVLIGNGNGTFRDRVEFDTGVKGELTIVAGDFNRDGLIDVATGNRSVERSDDLGEQLWDSISIMPGDGNGRFGTAATYALGTINRGDRDFVLTHNSLNTSDLNGDRHTDLIASPGMILINRPAAPNRVPRVFAGADRMMLDEEVFTLNPVASDADRHWLTYEWTLAGSSFVFPPVPAITLFHPAPGLYTLTLRVTDPYGASASDTVNIRVPDRNTDPLVDLMWDGPETVGSPSVINWEATAGRGLVRFDLWSSDNGGRSWGRIAECTGLPATARSCTWNRARDVVIRIVGIDRSGRQWIDLANEE